MRLELVGLDRPGIVRDVSQVLAGHGVNVEELVTNRVSAPMSGEMLFEASLEVAVAASADLGALRAALERTATDLMVDVKLEEAPKKKG
jgi:glycine cleavage system regulatory protein